MAEYLVEWKIEIDADSPEAAARKALAIQRNPKSIAVVFDVTDTDMDEEFLIDLLKELDNDTDR